MKDLSRLPYVNCNKCGGPVKEISKETPDGEYRVHRGHCPAEKKGGKHGRADDESAADLL